MSRRARHGDIGPLLVAARAQGVEWKQLMQHYGLGRTRLHQLYQAARAGVHEHRNAGRAESSALMLVVSQTGCRLHEPCEDRMSPKKPNLPPMQQAPSYEDPAVEEARRREIIMAQRARGRAASILTSGQGDLSDAPTARRLLMGG